MKANLLKKVREIKWTTEHSLTKEQWKTLIANKVERARKEVENRKKFSSHV